MRKSPTNSSGKNAANPSEMRMTPRDQRAVVIRWTPTNVTAAQHTVAQKSQFTWNACQARSLPVKAPYKEDHSPNQGEREREATDRRGGSCLAPALTTRSRGTAAGSCALMA